MLRHPKPIDRFQFDIIRIAAVNDTHDILPMTTLVDKNAFGSTVLPRLLTSRGSPLPLGASRGVSGINFAVLSRHATAVTLVILPEEGGSTPVAELPLDLRLNRTGDHWHISVNGLPDVFCYGWKVAGPAGSEHRFNPHLILLDPCSTALSNGAAWAGTCEADPSRTGRRSLYARSKSYDWGDDAPLHTPAEESIIYELHVRGFTIHPSSGVKYPGTFLGLVEKIPYLKWLGVTAVELLPVFEFDECDCPFINPITGEKLVNFWGYNPVGFAAPKAAFAATAKIHAQADEFRDMVREFHQAGIEVYLDVVFNHTGEGDDRGRTFHFRGLDNELYYLLDDAGRYQNYSGCGNTVNCNHPVVRELILECLRYWVIDMHVDGYRFDLASVLGRDRRGNVMADPPAVEMISDDGILSDVKLIAEPWDAGGAYQVGSFPGGRRWAEWNDKFRDDIRRFWRGDPGTASIVAQRVSGSSDIYAKTRRGPTHSVNFITCHDGFTLWDLVSYNHKHNEANGEGNRDGSDNNLSWNSGVEGDSIDPDVLALRLRRAKSLMATLLLSQGTPMLLGGDEMLRSQRGNNNAWCQDSDISWVNWSLVDSNAEFLRFTRELIWLRRRHAVFRRRGFLVGELGGYAADVHWHGVEPNRPDFGPNSRFVAYTLDGRFHGRAADEWRPDNDFFVVMNGNPSSVTFRVPPSPTGRPWRKLVDTAAASPDDVRVEDSGTSSEVSLLNSPIIEPGTAETVAAYATLVFMSDV